MTGLVVAGVGKLAESALLGKAKSMATAIPKPVWEAIAVLGYALALLALHQHQVHAHDAALVKATIASRDAQWQGRLADERTKADQVRVSAQKLHAQINQFLKDQHDAQVRSNASSAADLVRGGPGKAAASARCGPVDRPGVPAAAGGLVGPASGAASAAAQVPSGNGVPGVQLASPGALHDPDLALVSWRWLTEIGQEFDDLLAYKAEDQQWHAEHAAAWEKMRSAKPQGAIAPPIPPVQH